MTCPICKWESNSTVCPNCDGNVNYLNKKVVNIPTSVNEAVLMVGLGIDYLKQNAPHLLKENHQHISGCLYSICTKDKPMPMNAPGKWIHPDAISINLEDPYYDHYKCPNCGLYFSIEVSE